MLVLYSRLDSCGVVCCGGPAKVRRTSVHRKTGWKPTPSASETISWIRVVVHRKFGALVFTGIDGESAVFCHADLIVLEVGAHRRRGLGGRRETLGDARQGDARQVTAGAEEINA